MTTKKKVVTKNVKLFGGPLDGQTVAVLRGADHYDVGKPGRVFWRYTYAGKMDRQEMFAILPKQRMARRFIYLYVLKNGKDPRVGAHLMKQQPIVHTDKLSKHGQGARRRAEKRAA